MIGKFYQTPGVAVLSSRSYILILLLKAFGNMTDDEDFVLVDTTGGTAAALRGSGPESFEVF